MQVPGQGRTFMNGLANRSHRRRIGLLIAATAAMAGVVTSNASARLGAMSVISPPPKHGASNGASDRTAFSQDNRDVRIVAFDSIASNLVAGDTNGRRDVFALLKERGAGNLGGQLVKVSTRGRDGEGNGDSSAPSVDGTTGAEPHCVAFRSTATNLARGAANHISSIYVRDLATDRTALVSIGSRSATEPSIDGRCRAVAYSSRGWVLLRDLASHQVLQVARGAEPDQQTDGRGIAYRRKGQVYLQAITRTAGFLERTGRERLISDTVGGAPGNGVSSNPTVDDHGHHVAFQSTATDLCTRRCPGFKTVDQVDANGAMSDVFVRTLVQSRKGRFEPGMQLVSGGVGGQGNGVSLNPSISRAGQAVVFDSTSTNIASAYLRATRNVFRWYWSGVRGYAAIDAVSTAPPWLIPDSMLNGPSFNPSISSRGNYVAFTSSASGQDGDQNGSAIPDVFMRFMGLNHQGLPTS